MPASNKSSQAGKTFFNVFNGKFSKQVPQGYEPLLGEPPVVSRTNKVNKVVYEQHFSDLEGMMILNIEKKIHESFGAQWIITMKDVDETIELTLPYSSSVTKGLLFRLPNIQLSLPVTLSIYHFEKDGKTRLVVHQDGKKIEPYFSKDNPNGLPPMVEVMDKGVMKWNDSAQMLYIEGMLNANYAPIFAQLQAPGAQHAPVTHHATHPIQAPAPVAQPQATQPAPSFPDPMQAEYEQACSFGFAGDLAAYKVFKANKVAAAAPANAPQPSTVAAPATQFPAAQPIVQPEGNLAGIKGATVAPMTVEHGFNIVRERGYKGTIENYKFDLAQLGAEPKDVLVNAQGVLELDGLPF